jgi:NAD-specific glutamate dehydrogenase
VRCAAVDLRALQRAMTLEVLGKGHGTTADRLQARQAEARAEPDGVQRLLAALAGAKAADLAMLSVGMRKLRNLARAGRGLVYW